MPDLWINKFFAKRKSHLNEKMLSWCAYVYERRHDIMKIDEINLFLNNPSEKPYQTNEIEGERAPTPTYLAAKITINLLHLHASNSCLTIWKRRKKKKKSHKSNYEVFTFSKKRYLYFINFLSMYILCFAHVCTFLITLKIINGSAFALWKSDISLAALHFSFCAK